MAAIVSLSPPIEIAPRMALSKSPLSRNAIMASGYAAGAAHLKAVNGAYLIKCAVEVIAELRAYIILYFALGIPCAGEEAADAMACAPFIPSGWL